MMKALLNYAVVTPLQPCVRFVDARINDINEDASW